MENALQKILAYYGACPEALIWSDSHHDPVEAWNECLRGDWLFWIANQVHFGKKALVLAACEIAEEALKRHWKQPSRLPMKVIEVTRQRVVGESTSQEVKEAIDSARSADSLLTSASAYAAMLAATNAYFADSQFVTFAAEADYSEVIDRDKAATQADIAGTMRLAREAQLEALERMAAVVRKHVNIADLLKCLPPDLLSDTSTSA